MPDLANNFVFGSAVPTNKLGFVLPEPMIRQGLFSPDSDAWRCFVLQGFSNRLQAYLVNYNMTISSYYPLYG